MRKFGEYDLSKLSDSRMLYLRSPPKFTYILVAIIVIVLIGTVVWSAVTIKATEVQVAGIITSDDKQMLYIGVTGIVSEVNYAEGDTVFVGDIIVGLDKSSIDIAIRKDADQISAINKEINCIDTMQKQIARDNLDQPFGNKTSPIENQYYYMFESYVSSYKAYSASPESQGSFKTQTISQLTSNKSTLTSNLVSLQAELDSYRAQLPNYDIKTTTSGILHFNIEIRNGMTLQAGSQIGSISNQDANQYVDLYIAAAQRALIEVGQECNFTIDGLAQTEYGSIQGTVKSISSDAIIQESGAYFQVKVSFDAKYIQDSKGGKVTLSNGMTVRVWVTYEKVTYLKYWMEQLGLGKYF